MNSRFFLLFIPIFLLFSWFVCRHSMTGNSFICAIKLPYNFQFGCIGAVLWRDIIKVTIAIRYSKSKVGNAILGHYEIVIFLVALFAILLFGSFFGYCFRFPIFKP